MWLTRSLLKWKFSDVPQVSTGELADMQNSAEAGMQPILLDVREEDEYAVSHIAGAVRVDVGDTAVAALVAQGYTPGRPVVCYCSVGYRSCILARALRQEEGAPQSSDVFNLDGSIFEWANQGRAVVREGKPAAGVHPFNSTFGMLLNSSLRATTAPQEDP